MNSRRQPLCRAASGPTARPRGGWPFRQLARSLAGWLALALLLAGQTPALAAQTRRVAVLVSYEQTLPWSREFLAGLAEAKARHGSGLELSIEFLDRLRFPTPAQEQALRDLLAARYATDPPDAIVAESHDALRFLERHGPAVFGATPVVLIANRGQDYTVANVRSVLDNEPWIQATARLVLAVDPATERVLVFGDAEGQGRVVLDLALAALAGRRPRVEVEVASGLTVEEMAQRARELPPRSAVLFTLTQSDRHGNRLVSRDVVARVAGASSAPVYAFYDTLMGRGIAGGYLVSARQMAALAVDEALSVASGNPPALPSVPDPPAFDRRALDRWGIPVQALPAGSRVLFEEPPFYRRYVRETAAIAAVVALEALLALVLARLFLQRRRLARQLAQANLLLEERVAERTRELGRLAVTDELTGLVNRREFTRLASREMERARRSGRDFSLVMVDLDHFKDVNDRLGHASGDAVLRGFAALMAASLRKADTVARFGGEEFVALLPDTEPGNALVAVEKLRLLVEGADLHAGEAPPQRITASFGVAGSAEAGRDLDALIRLADERLYEAKRAGRNRACGPRPAPA